jgi:hypothetical protein
MKTQKLTPVLLIAIFFCFNISIVNALPFTTHLKSTNKTSVKLNYVFVKEVDSTNKDILKLYDDFTYEFLFFQKFKNKPKVKREKGTYSLKKGKLVLDKETKTELKEHPYHFLFIENKGLIKSKWFSKSKTETEFLYELNNDAKYWLPTYHDPYFGDITNDKKASKKIIEKKPEYNPIATLPSYTTNTQYENIDESLNTNIAMSTSLLSKDSLRMLKAIIIVGHVGGWWQEMFLAEQKKNAKYLRSMGVQVLEFYYPNDKWKNIIKASEGANILIYSGHGSNQGINYDVGGLCLADGIYGAQDLLNNLKLKKNAIVIFNSACSSAGTSAGDNGDIGVNEAIKRVSEYAYPFIKLGSACYFANNNIDCVIPFFEMLFNRKKIDYIFRKELSFDEKVVAKKAYSYDQNYTISVSSYPGTNKMVNSISYVNDVKKVEKVLDGNKYSLAYVSKPNFTVVDLFKN